MLQKVFIVWKYYDAYHFLQGEFYSPWTMNAAYHVFIIWKYHRWWHFRRMCSASIRRMSFFGLESWAIWNLCILSAPGAFDNLGLQYKSIISKLESKITLWFLRYIVCNFPWSKYYDSLTFWTQSSENYLWPSSSVSFNMHISKQVLADIPTPQRSDMLKALIIHSNSPSMVSALS